MPLPKQIKFGTYVAKIIYEKQSRDHDYFTTDIVLQELRVYTEYPLETIKYECFQGIIYLLLGYLIRIVGEKKFCLDQFSRILYSLLRSNPELVNRKIPDKVIIIGKNFNILYRTQLEDLNFGDKDYSFGKITLQDNMEKRQMFTIFWHEIIHEILYIIDESFNKEDFVHQLAIMVSELIYGNDLMWIFEEDEKVEK